MRHVIFGAGIVGEKVLIAYQEQLDIEAIFDNNKTGVFYGYKIKKPEYKDNIFIIVASDRYFEIRKQLTGLGYSEFYDFVPYQIFNKKIAIAYGNCHICAVKEYLEHNKEFTQNYGFYPFPTIHTMNLMENYEIVLAYCDLFIHQSIRKENKYGEKYASESMMVHLSGQCRIISVPNLYRMPECFFPQQKLEYKEIRRGMFSFNAGKDENVEKWVQEGKTEEEIKNYIVYGGVYKRTEVLDMWKCFEDKLLDREKEWDIKISDYILDNYKSRKLFYERLHISNNLVKEIATRVLRYMGYRGDISCELPIWLDSNEMFIYQDVMEALDLRFEQKYIRLSQKCYSLNKCDMDIDEYIHQLCKWESAHNKMLY